MSKLVIGTPEQKGTVIFVPVKRQSFGKSELEDVIINSPKLPLFHFKRKSYIEDEKYNLILRCINKEFVDYLENFDNPVKIWLVHEGRNHVKGSNHRGYSYEGAVKTMDCAGNMYSTNDYRLNITVDEHTEVIVENGETVDDITHNFKTGSMVSCRFICDGFYIHNNKAFLKLRALKCFVSHMRTDININNIFD